MRAVVIDRPGGPEVLRWAEVDDPVPGAGEVLVDVVASAVNRADILQREGRYPPPAGAPPHPGLECSGRIAALGPGLSGSAGLSVGDEVCALLSGGGYAQRVVAAAGCVMPVPAGVTLLAAAALPEVACTVWSNLAGVANLKAGETLLVHGGASGIGTFAIQYAVALGATVYATARGAKHDAITALGATPIDYEREDFSAVAEVDVILDIIGGPYLDRNLNALRVGGRLVIIGMQGGRRGELNIGTLLGKRATVAGTTLRARPLEEKAAIVRGVLHDIWPLLGSGRIKPVIDRIIPMENAAEAHQIVQASAHTGKVLLTT